MRVRMLVDISGTRNGLPWPQRGGETEVPDDEGEALIAAQQAMAVTTFEKPAVETATVPDESVEATVIEEAETGTVEEPTETATRKAVVPRGRRRRN